MTTLARCMSVIENLTRQRVMVVGDIMLDRFVFGTVERISPEAPVPVLRTSHEQITLGGAANVARNLASIGARIDLIGIVGDDPEAATVEQLLTEAGTVRSRLIRMADRPTTRKIRFVGGTQHLIRADTEVSTPIDSTTQARIAERVRDGLADADVLLLSDYAKGVLTPDLTRELIALARAAGVPVFVDPKGRDYARYRHASVVTPNRHELADAAGRRMVSLDDFRAAAGELAAAGEFGAILVTLGEDGMLLVERDGHSRHWEAEARRVVDVSGAGDTVVAVFAACRAAGADNETAAYLANLAAGVVVGKRGTATLDRTELEDRLRQAMSDDASTKILSAERARRLMAEWKAAGLRVGFTNGVFDLLHPGHVHLLMQARRQCDHLLVGLNADASVSRLKGPGRPIQNEMARALVLSSLACVDGVVLFESDTPIELIRALRPDILFKGADYSLAEVVGAEEVAAYGGAVRLVEIVPQQSTTEIVERAGATLGRS